MLKRRPVLVVLLAAVLAFLPSTAAQADPPVSAPASGQLLLDGRGYGHGRGMSQWGAFGAASQGLAWPQILAFYYPGTTRTVLGNSDIRIWVSRDDNNDVRVDPRSGLSLQSGGRTVLLPTGSAYDSWRLVRSAGVVVLQRLDGSTWSTFPVSGGVGANPQLVSAAGPLRLVLPDGTRAEIPGALRALPYGSSVLRTVAVLPMETYLRGVVPAEMPAGWHTDALRAQAVAARTYAARLRATAPASRGYDACDTVSCQVWNGSATYRADGTLLRQHQHPRTDTAIAATAGTVLTSGGSLILTEFSASNGGWTTASSLPYQVAKADPYDALQAPDDNAWQKNVSVTTVQNTYPAIGSLRTVTITQRTGAGPYGGRVLQMRLAGSRGAVTITGEQARSAFGLRSTLFTVLGDPAFTRDFTGDGYPDVLAITSTGLLLAYRGGPDGRFTGSQQIGNGWGARDLVTQVGDWDGDGAADVVARDPSTGALWLYRGNGRGGFAGARTLGVGWGVADTLIGPGDWDGDGAADVVARDPSTGALWLYRGNGRGGFAGARTIGVGWGVADTLIGPGDWDGDGAVDLLMRRPADGSLWLYRGNGTGGFAGGKQIGNGWRGMTLLTAVGDVDDDGDPDLVAVSRAGVPLLYTSNGVGGFGPTSPLGTSLDASTALLGPGDFDGDGRPDLLRRDTVGRLFLLPGTGGPGFGPATQVGQGWSLLRLVG
ncbi:SpoIID/LytB domain-containing protein [Aquipuribacter sp. MA13-6]|uniref:SpoIID/LytB domain-containing protein n=1 Tax=Aquipuribacter sp. MA13-6 TaxID=3440839 RepID=UPI003EEC2479